jgi:LysR family transcriptional regulator of abg operon
MKLSHIRDLIAIADCGSLRAAAQKLGLAQPALTRSIHEIERELGVDLFERQTRGMRLTPFGEVFLRRMRSIQSELQRSRDEIDQLRGLAVGHVSVGLSIASTIVLLPDSLAPFRRKFPDVRLKIVEGLFPGLRRQITDGDLDFYVGPVIEHPIPREFAVEALFENERIVLGRRGHPLRSAATLLELKNAQWIGLAIATDRGEELGPIFQASGLPPPVIVIETGSALTTIMIAANSDLLALLPRQYLKHPGVTELLEPIRVREKLTAPTICLVRRSNLPLTPAAEFLSDLIRRAAVTEASTA